MKRLVPQDDWPDSWKYSYPFDQKELWNHNERSGYAYAYKNRRDRAISLISEALPGGARILDVAGGQGNFSLSLAEAGYRVVWNDLREDLEGYIRLKHEYGDISFRPGNVLEIDFGEEFDAVLITEIIEHVAHPDEFLRRIASLVRSGGYIVMTTPNGRYFRNSLPRFSECEDSSIFEAIQFRPNSDGHIFLLWPDEIRSLANQAGLNVDKQVTFNTFLTNGHVKTGKLLPILPEKVVFAFENIVAKLPSYLCERLMVHTAVRFLKS